jgi:hypothetical protein
MTTMADFDKELNDPDLARMGAAIEGLSRATPPSDLVARTMARISERCTPVKKVFWMLRPITHPVARIAAAAMIIFALTPMTDVNIADPIGAKIEKNIIGSQTAENVEHFLDRLLVRYNSAQDYTQCNPDVFMGANRTVNRLVRRIPAKQDGV